MYQNNQSRINLSLITIIALIIIVIIETITIIVLNSPKEEETEIIGEDSDSHFLYNENNFLEAISTACKSEQQTYQFYLSGQYDITNNNGAIIENGTYYFKNDSTIQLSSDQKTEYVLSYSQNSITNNKETYSCDYEN